MPDRRPVALPDATAGGAATSPGSTRPDPGPDEPRPADPRSGGLIPGGLTLGFDTSAAHCAAALVSGDAVLAQIVEPMARGQAERLFPLLEALLAEAGCRWGDLTAVGVGTGPGNFTGIRIAVAAARGLALSLGIPAVGVGVTEAAALDLPRPCRVIVQTRGDEVVWQDFAADPSPDAALSEAHLPPSVPAAPPATPAATASGTPHPPAPSDAAPASAAPAPSAPSGGAAQGSASALPPGPPVREPRWPLAVAIARIAAARAGRPGLPRPAPLYLRPADAAPARETPPVILP